MTAETDPAEISRRADELAPRVAGRLAEVRARIEAAGGEPGAITVVAVTKTFGPEAAVAAVRAGMTDVGENYADELVSKSELVAATGTRPRWHFLGAIQRRKVGRLSGVVDCWQGLSRPTEAEAIVARRGEHASSAFVEVNVAGDPHRPGCAPSEVPSLVASCSALGLEVRGLMAVAPIGGPEVALEAFRSVAQLAGGLGLAELSLGMSADLEQAVAAGTTMVRIGTALFGERVTRGPGRSL